MIRPRRNEIRPTIGRASTPVLCIKVTTSSQRSESRRMLFGRLALLRWAYSVLGLLALFAFGVLLGVVT